MDTVLLTTALAIMLLAASYALHLRQRRKLLQAQIDVLEAHLARATLAADTLCMTIAKHLEAKDVLLDECDKLEAQNHWLKGVRNKRNAEIMRHHVMPHQRGH